MTDLVPAAARNIAGWHECCLASLGVASRYEGATWVCEEPAPFIYLGAVTLGGAYRAGEHFETIRLLAEKRSGTFAFNDTWAVLDPAPLGFSVFGRESWFARQAGAPLRGQPLITVERVTTPAELVEFEEAQHLGFETPELLELGQCGVYGRGLLDDPRMHIYVVRAENGEVTGGSMGFVEAGVVGVYSVATRPEYRRRGYGEALTWAALGSAPELPAVLQPSEMGEPIYQRMGFAPVGRFTNWIRRA
jgi:ribosomal protein S18 acetylase RimI-like enzyme